MKKKQTIKDNKTITKKVRLNNKQVNLLNDKLSHFDGVFSKFIVFHIENTFDYDQNVIIKDTNNSSLILKEINKIGVNINQITRYLNMQKSNIKHVSFSKIEKDLSKLVVDLTTIKRKLMNNDN